MLRKIADHIKDCLDRAAEARRRAEERTDQRRKAEYLRAELRWLRLARHFEFAKALSVSCSSQQTKRFGTIELSKLTIRLRLRTHTRNVATGELRRSFGVAHTKCVCQRQNRCFRRQSICP